MPHVPCVLSAKPEDCIVTIWGGKEGDCSVRILCSWTSFADNRFFISVCIFVTERPHDLCYCSCLPRPPLHLHPQAGNGVYEFKSMDHPGGGDTFVQLCRGNGRTKGKPLKTVNWLNIQGAFHGFVASLETKHSA